jgi:hypothetical protein
MPTRGNRSFPDERNYNRTAPSDHERHRQKTKRLLEKYDVEVITVEYDEVHKYGGGIRCNTMQLIRDPGPTTFG